MENNINNSEKNNSLDNNKKETKRVIKTYRDFAVNALDDKPTSLANMIIQEKKKQARKEAKSIKNPKNVFMVILSSILVILGIGAIASIIIFVNTKKDDSLVKNNISNIESTIEYDYKKSYELDDLSSVKKASNEAFNDTNIPFGTVKNIFFTKKDSLGYSRQVSAKDFIITLDTRVPNQFIRNLKKRFSVGLVSLDKNVAFMILETYNFDTSYSNMLTWEKTILYDIGYLFKVNQKYYANKFKDIVFKNKDIRAILDEEGNLIFAYSFVTPHKIIFFTDTKSFEILMSGLQNIVKK